MSSHIPQDVDELMWAVAESPTSQALDDFERRFPQYRGEMGRRLQMVRELKAAGKAMPVESIPRFEPHTAPTASQRPFAVAAAAIALAALGFASFQAVQRWNAPSTPNPVTQGSGEQHVPTGRPEVIEPVRVPQGNGPSSGQTPPSAPRTAPQPAKMSIRLAGVTLSAALQLVAEQAKIRLDIAPGLPETMVDADFTDRTAGQILSELGEAYGFTPLAQEPGVVLIVPARDKASDSTANPEGTPPSGGESGQ